MSPRRLVLLTLALVLLVGCATPGKVSTSLGGDALTESERAEAQVIEAAIGKLCDVIRQNSGVCYSPRIVVNTRDAHPTYDGTANAIVMHRNALTGAWAWRAAIAHELSHWAFNDAHRPQCGDPVVCERNANADAVQVLTLGFGYEQREAISTMWRLLEGMVRIKVKPSPGHPDACAELHDFERRAGVTSLYACAEGAAK